MVFFLIILFPLDFYRTHNSLEVDSTQIVYELNKGCYILSTVYDCDPGQIENIETGIVKEDRKNLNLLELCRIKTENSILSAKECLENCRFCSKKLEQSEENLSN